MASSKSSFQREFTEWEKILLFQRVSTHAICSDCGKYHKLRAEAKTVEQKENVCSNHGRHLTAVFADSDMVSFWHRMSVESTRTGHTNKKQDLKYNQSLPSGSYFFLATWGAKLVVAGVCGGRGLWVTMGLVNFESWLQEVIKDNTILFLQLDGMDQAKFRCPRALPAQSTKLFETCWRPTLHVVGVLISGVVEAFYVMDTDLPADSNMENHLIMRSLDIARHVLNSRGVAMPAHLVVLSDNTARELRNQWGYKLQAYLVSRQLFKSTTVAHKRVGHSHGKCDQRFSIIGVGLRKAEVLQCPEEFQGHINLCGTVGGLGDRQVGSE